MCLWRLLIFLMLAKEINCAVTLDCGQSEQLCPGSHTVSLHCHVEDNFLQWTSGQFKEVDFNANDNEGYEECHNWYCGTLDDTSNGYYSSTLTFNSSLVAEGTVIACAGLPLTNIAAQQCNITHLDTPSPPDSLQYNHSQTLLTWSGHSTNYTHLTYQVTISRSEAQSSDGDDPAVLLSMSTTANNLLLDVRDYQPNTEYVATVKTVLCDGSLQGNEASVNFTIPSILTTTTQTRTVDDFSSSFSFASLSSPTISSSSTSSRQDTIIIGSSSSGSVLTPSTGVPATSASSKNTEEPSTSDTENESDDNDDTLKLVISFIIGGVFVLIVVIIVMVLLFCFFLALIKRVTNNNHQTTTTAVVRDTSSHQVSPAASPTLALTAQPPPLPPRPRPPRPRPAHTYTNIDIELTTVSPLYDDPHHLNNSVSAQQSISEYGIPFFGRILFPQRNSKPTLV